MSPGERDAPDSVILERLDRLREDLRELKPIMAIVTTHQEKLSKLEKDNSGHHQAFDTINPKLQKLAESDAARTASNRTLFWAIGIFAGANVLSNIIRILWGGAR